MKLTLYYKKGCPYCQKVLDHLKKLEKDLPKKDINEDSKIRDELIRIGGKAQVPCLLIDNNPLYESDQINAWLSKHLHQLSQNN